MVDHSKTWHQNVRFSDPHCIRYSDNLCTSDLFLWFCKFNWTFSARISEVLAEWKSLPEDKKSRYVAESEKLKAVYIEAKAKWNEAIEKSGKSEDLEKLNEKLKVARNKKKLI